MEVDRLEVIIEAEASKANKQLDSLITKLNSVSSAMSGVNTSGLLNLSNGITRLSKSMQSMSGVKTTDFTRLARNIQSLSGLNTTGLYQTSNSLRNLTSSLNGIGSVSQSTVQLGEVAKNISKLGNVSTQKALATLPQLSNSLRDFMTTLSTAPAVSQNLIDMTNAMGNLASQGSKYGSTINGIARASKTLAKDSNTATNSTNRFSSAQNRAKSSAMSLTAQLSKLAFAFFTIKRAISAIGNSIQKSMDFTETVNLFDTSFKKIGMETASKMGMEWGSESADTFAKGFITEAKDFNNMLTNALSLDPSVMMKYQALFAQMTNSMGLVSKSAMNISESFTMLGTDIASLWNMDIDKAMTKLQAGLAGQIRPLRELGVDISQTSLEMTALKYGITDSVKDMSQAAKVQLRWLAIMDQTEVAFGDMAKTINSPANQLRILKQQWTNLSRSIGNVFLPVVTTILPFINALVLALRQLIDTLATAVGFELPDYSDSNIYTESPVVTDIVGGYDDVADSADKAAKANEKLKKSFLGIDEVNVLDSGSSGSSGGGSGSSAGGGSGYSELDDAIAGKTASYMSKFNEELKKMNDNAKEMSEKIVGFFQDIGEAAEPTFEAVKNLWDNGLSKFVTFVWTGLSSFYSDFLVPVGTWVLGEGLPSLIDSVGNLISDIDWKNLNDSLEKFNKAMAPFAISVGKGLVDFVKDLSETLKPVVASTMDLLADALDALADAIKSISPEDAENLGYGLGKLFAGIALFAGLTSAINNLSKLAVVLKSFGKSLKSISLLDPVSISILFGDFVNDLDDWIAKNLEEKLGPVWKNLYVVLGNAGIGALTGAAFGGLPGAIIGALVGGLIAVITTLDLSSVWNTLMKGLKTALATVFNFDKTKELFKGMIDNFTAALNGDNILEIGGNIVQGIFDGIGAALALLLEPIFDLFEGIITGVMDLFGIHSPSTVFADIGKNLVLGLKKGITDSWESFITFITGLPGKIVKGFGDIKTLFVTKGANILSGIKKGWTDGWPNFNTWLGGLPQKIANAIGSLVSVGKGLMNELIQGIKSVSIPKIEIGVTGSYSAPSGGASILTKEQIKKLPRKANGGIIPRKFATGGIPNFGSMFIAREAGPELVGRWGNGGSAVMNNNQIVESVSSGVADAVARVVIPIMAGSGENGGNTTVRVPIIIGKEQIAEAVLDGIDKRNRRFQTSVNLV